jgi:hypothetical protein
MKYSLLALAIGCAVVAVPGVSFAQDVVDEGQPAAPWCAQLFNATKGGGAFTDDFTFTTKGGVRDYYNLLLSLRVRALNISADGIVGDDDAYYAGTMTGSYFSNPLKLECKFTPNNGDSIKVFYCPNGECSAKAASSEGELRLAP